MQMDMTDMTKTELVEKIKMLRLGGWSDAQIIASIVVPAVTDKGLPSSALKGAPQATLR